MVLGVVLIAEVMDLLDSTIITIAAPTVRVDLGGSTATMQWWSAAYTLAFGVFLIVGGRLGDAFGRRRLFVIGIAGFTLMSVACALAPSPDWLIVDARAAGRVRRAADPAGSRRASRPMFPPEEMGGAFGAFGPVMGIAAICGPILAGWLVSADLLGTGWRMIFLINLPVGLLGLVGALALMPESSSSRRVRLDIVGVGLISVASLCIIYPLVQGREQGWPLWIFGVLALGIVLLGVFGLAERREHGSPLIEPSLLQNRAFTGGLALGVVFFTAFGGLGLVLSLYTQLGLHFSALHAGLTMAPLLARRRDRGGLVLRADPALRAPRAAGGARGGRPLDGGARADRAAHGRRHELVGSRAVARRVRDRPRLGLRADVQHHPGRRARARGGLGVRHADRDPAARQLARRGTFSPRSSSR